MNDKTEEALARMIDLAVDGIEGAKSFAEAELPSVVEQLLMWKMLESLIYTFVPLTLLAAVVLSLGRILLKISQARESRDNDGCAPYTRNIWWSTYGWSDTAISLIVTHTIAMFLMLLASAIYVNLTWLQILVAPKIYLLEYASALVK